MLTVLADVNIDHVVEFVSETKSMASFARASRHTNEIINGNILHAINNFSSRMTKFQKDTLSNLSNNPGIGHLKAIVERKCIVCKKDYKGGIRAPWGIPAHSECTKSLEVNVRYVEDDEGIPPELMSLLRSTIPVKVREGYSRYIGQYGYETVIPDPIPGIIPEEMTLVHFNKVHWKRISNVKQRIRQQKVDKENKRKRDAKDRQVERSKKQKILNENRRNEIESMVNMPYLKWMRTIPSDAKKLISKLSALESVALVAAVNENADQPENVHEVILKPGNLKPLASSVRAAYRLVTEMGPDILKFIRHGNTVHEIRNEYLNIQRKKARLEAKSKNLVQGSRICRCGSPGALKCIFQMCRSCCPRQGCGRHGLK